MNPSITAVTNPTGTITVLPGNTTTITASGGTNYVWFPTTNLTPNTGATVAATPSQTTTYCVEIETNNCKDTTCITIEVELPCPTNENLQVPNAFSPNGDGVNDEFCLQGWDGCIESFSIIIFNRWGEKVFESVDPNFCWDGTWKGPIMPARPAGGDAQVFVYHVRATFHHVEKSIIKKGNITLIR